MKNNSPYHSPQSESDLISVNHLIDHQAVQVLVKQSLLEFHLAQTLDKSPEQIKKILNSENNPLIEEVSKDSWQPYGAGMILVDHDRQQVLGICANLGRRVEIEQLIHSSNQSIFMGNDEMWKDICSKEWMAVRKIVSVRTGMPHVWGEETSLVEFELLNQEFNQDSTKVCNYIFNSLSEEHPHHRHATMPNGEVCSVDYFWTLTMQVENWDFTRILDRTKTPKEWAEGLEEMGPVFFNEKNNSNWKKWIESLSGAELFREFESSSSDLRFNPWESIKQSQIHETLTLYQAHLEWEQKKERILAPHSKPSYEHGF